MFDFARITEVKLDRGQHGSPAEGMCFMEMVAWFEGEEHSDRPSCASRVLGSYGIALNDRMPDDLRDRLLKPLVPMIAGTRGREDDEIRRSRFLVMWSINRMVPVALRAIKLDDLALQCEQAGDVVVALPILEQARKAAAGWRAAEAAAAAAAAAAAGWRAAEAAAAGWRAAEAAAAGWRAAEAAAAGWRAAEAAAAEPVWALAVEGLREAILIGPHAGFSPTVDFEARHDDLRQLVRA